jgi:hypothetical protein
MSAERSVTDSHEQKSEREREADQKDHNLGVSRVDHVDECQAHEGHFSVLCQSEWFI